MDRDTFIKRLQKAVQANLRTGVAELSIRRSGWEDSDRRRLIYEANRDLKHSITLPYSYSDHEAELIGREIAKAIDRHDDACFDKWEIIPDPSQHSRMDEDGIIKRAGATPKYVYRKGQHGLLKGMPEGLALAYDDWCKRGSVDNAPEGKEWDGERWRDLDQEEGWRRALTDKEAKRRAADQVFKDLAEKRTAEARETREAEKRRKVTERETFYEQSGDFGLF